MSDFVRLSVCSRCWNSALDSHLLAMGFTQSDHDPCMYISGEDDKFIITVYVDDMILAGSKTDAIENVKKKLSSKFDIKDLGELKYFLGMTVIQDNEKGTTWMGQPAFIERLLIKMKMENCNSTATPMNSGVRLVTV